MSQTFLLLVKYLLRLGEFKIKKNKKKKKKQVLIKKYLNI